LFNATGLPRDKAEAVGAQRGVEMHDAAFADRNSCPDSDAGINQRSAAKDGARAYVALRVQRAVLADHGSGAYESQGAHGDIGS